MDVVKMERRRKQRDFFRWFWRITGVVFLVVLVGSVYFLGKSTLDLVLEKTVYTNKMFTLRHVDIRTYGAISSDRVMEFLNVRVGEDNVMALDLGELKRKLESVSVVERASVERSIPDKLRVYVYVRNPVARCYVRVASLDTLTGGEYLVRYMDKTGYVMTPDELFYEVNGKEQLVLPIITGAPGREVILPNQYCGNRRVKDALMFIQYYRKSFLFGADDLLEVDVSDPGFIVAKTTQGIEAILSADNIKQGFARLHSVYLYGKANEQRIKTIDVSVTNNVPVVWYPPEKKSTTRAATKSLHSGG